MKYEYKCPFCGYINVRYEECGRVVCLKCGRGFTP
jgi:ribosomal protein L37AE/L43A